MVRRLALALLATVVACGSGGGHSGTKAATPSSVQTSTSTRAAGMVLASSAFKDGDAIPTQYTCDGANLSPPLAWSGMPTGTVSLALQVQDIDTAQKFVHWLVYDFPPQVTSMATGQAPPGAKQATNSFGKTGYGGPCPPAGSKHRYVFTLLALSTTLHVSESVSPNDLWATLERSAPTGKAELTGTYQRKGS